MILQCLQKINYQKTKPIQLYKLPETDIGIGPRQKTEGIFRNIGRYYGTVRRGHCGAVVNFTVENNRAIR